MNKKKFPPVAIIIGSKSDMEHAQSCLEVLKELGINHELRVLSAHRNPEELFEFIKEAELNGTEIFIAMAGGSAHLPGVIASRTLKPVIGVPVPTGFMGGLDSLLSIVQMPSGIPVATVGANKGGPVNAAILAALILSLRDEKIKEKVKEFREKLKRGN